MITKQRVYIGDFSEEALKTRKNYGTTDLFTTGFDGLDKYLGGGFGRKDGYEVVLLYGPTGIGKSLVGLNFLVPAILSNVKVGMLVLEDDMADASARLSYILGMDQWKSMNSRRLVMCLPKDALQKSWRLDDLLEYIEYWFVKENVELILLDHIQFAFEGAESIKGENEWTAQRVFMQKLNQLMKRVNKTIILVSHVNKAPGSKGMDKIVGSGSIAQASTKVIEVAKEDGKTKLRLYKSRFTATPEWPHLMTFKGTALSEEDSELPL